MDNQHRKISGYRELTQKEIDLMNEAKQLEARCLELHERIRETVLEGQIIGSPEAYRTDESNARRWHAIARTDIETGFMALVRSIAKPQPVELDT